jgi:hypothetical protein
MRSTIRSKLDETLVRWVLTARAVGKHTPPPSAAGALWVAEQSRRIDAIGLDAWLESDAPRYSVGLPWMADTGDGPKRKTCDCPPGKCRGMPRK